MLRALPLYRYFRTLPASLFNSPWRTVEKTEPVAPENTLTIRDREVEKGEPLMKAISAAKIYVALAAFAIFGVPHAYAQEGYDHFDAPNMEPFEKTKINTNSQAASVRLERNFSLPYSVQCNGKSLPPGKYLLSLSSDGRIAQLTLKGAGQAMKFEGLAQKPAPDRRPDALVVERSGRSRQLSVIQFAQLDLILSPDPGLAHPSDGKPRTIEKLPLRLADAPK
jgi:hypothetical protein